MEDTSRELFENCIIPDNTELQEHTLMTDRCIVVGDRCRIDYGLSGKDVIVCEFSSLNGDVHCDGDLRIDNFCEVSGDVFVSEDAYLGEGVKILGRLIVNGDLDIGDNVLIEKGFEAKGWISIRNPMPVITYIVLYLVALLGIEKEEEINEILEKLFGYDEDITEVPLMIPSNSVLNLQTFSVPRSMTIGENCRLHGNIKAGSVKVGRGNTIFGSLRTDESVEIREENAIHGDVYAGGAILICEKVHILGDVRCEKLTLHEDAFIEGTIKAPGGVKIERDPCY